MTTSIAYVILASVVSISGVSSSVSADSAADVVELSDVHEKRKIAAVALKNCKSDANTIRQQFEQIGDRDMDPSAFNGISNTLGQWAGHIKTLEHAVSELGEAPDALPLIQSLRGEVGGLAKAIRAVKGKDKVSKKEVQGFKRKELKARNKQAEASGLLEPVIFR